MVRRTRQSLPLVALLLSLDAGVVPCRAFMTSRRQPFGHVGHQISIHNKVALSMAVAKTGGKLMRDESDFADNVLENETTRPVLVFFTAPWCGPCRLSVPVVKDVLNEYAGRLDVVEVCTDDLPEVASDAGVVSIPTIQLYFQGELLDTIVGCVARNVLASSVEKVLEESLGSGRDEENSFEKDET